MNIPEVIDATDAQAANMINSVGLGISKRHDILSIIKKKSSKLSLDYKTLNNLLDLQTKVKL